MTAKKTVSVVILTRNTPLILLKKCIDSVKSQTYPALEILLMDANDPSSTYKEAIQSDTELQNGLIYLEHPDHNECIHAVNEATAQATGHFLVLITSQDIMPKERIECCMDFFEKNPSCNVLATNVAIQQNTISENDDLSLTSAKLSYVSQLIFCRYCFDMVSGFDTGLVAHADEDFIFKLYQNNTISHINTEQTTIYCNSDRSLTDSDKRCAIGYRQLLVKYAVYLQKRTDLKKDLLFSIANSYRQEHFYLRYLQFYWKAKLTKRKKERS